MSLNWDVSNVKDKDSVCWVGEGDKRRLSGTTETLILLSPALGLGEISETSWPLWYARLVALEAANGPSRTDGKDGIYFTVDEVRQHIGLKINVAPETDAKFYERIKLMLQDRAKREIRRWEAKHKEEVGE